MGNAALRDLAAIRTVPLAEVGGSVVAVDAHNWLYRYLTTTVKFTREEAYTTAEGEEVANLIGVVQGVAKLLEADVSPVFVFDGAVTDLKADEIERRREERERAEERLADARERDDAVAAARLEARTQRLTPVIHETTRGLFDRLGLPYVEAPAEGEAQAAFMNRRGDADYVASEDYDALLFGAPRTLRGLTGAGDPELMELDATLERHGITWEQLVDVAILTGTDFNEGVAGIGPKTALDAIREHGDLWGALDTHDAHVPGADRIRALFLDPPVTEAYDLDAAIDPDVPAARAYVVEEWGVAADEVDRAFERIEATAAQTGLDRWT
ncbi:MAG: flap endonuclease-1 [Haloferacaceae archaeon]